MENNDDRMWGEKWYFHFTHNANNLSVFLFGFVM